MKKKKKARRDGNDSAASQSAAAEVLRDSLMKSMRHLPIRPAGRFERTPKRVAEYDATRNL